MVTMTEADMEAQGRDKKCCNCEHCIRLAREQGEIVAPCICDKHGSVRYDYYCEDYREQKTCYSCVHFKADWTSCCCTLMTICNGEVLNCKVKIVHGNDKSCKYFKDRFKEQK